MPKVREEDRNLKHPESLREMVEDCLDDIFVTDMNRGVDPEKIEFVTDEWGGPHH